MFLVTSARSAPREAVTRNRQPPGSSGGWVFRVTAAHYAPRTAVGVARYPVPEARGARGGSRLRFRGAGLRRIKRGFDLNRGARELFGQGSGSWLAPGHARRRVRHRRLRFAQLPDAHGYYPALPAARDSKSFGDY